MRSYFAIIIGAVILNAAVLLALLGFRKFGLIQYPEFVVLVVPLVLGVLLRILLKKRSVAVYALVVVLSLPLILFILFGSIVGFFLTLGFANSRGSWSEILPALLWIILSAVLIPIIWFICINIGGYVIEKLMRVTKPKNRSN